MSVAAPVDGPNETGGRNINNLVRYLSPKKFHKMFTTEKCTYEEKVIRDILECMCALRNSGGGKLTLCFTGTYSKKDAGWCIDYIKEAVDKVLFATAKTDLVELKLPNRVTLLIKSSKEIVIMKANVMTNEKPKLDPSTASAAEVRPHSHHPQKQEQRDDDTETDLQSVQTSHMRKKTPASPSPQLVKLVKGQKIWNTQRLSHEEPVAFYRLKKIKKIISDRDRDDLLDFANHDGGRLYYGISSDGKVCGEKISEQEKEALCQEVKKKIELILRPKDDKKIHKIWKITFLPVTDPVTDRHSHNLHVIEIHVKPCSDVLVETSVVYYLGENGVEKMPLSDWNASLRYSTTAVPDMTTIIEFETTKEAFELCFLPKDYTTILKSLDWVESCSVVDKNEECDAPHLEIVCKFGKVPRTADIVNYFGEEILPFITYQEVSKREWFEKNILDESYHMKEEYDDKLSSLDWVESCSVVDKNEKCDAPHLEIVCKFGKVPCTANIVNYFGEEILPFITYQEVSKREWFEKNIFDEFYDMKEEYDDELLSFSWVKDYEIGVTSKPEKSWQIYITCAKNKVPRMDQLKELFGVNIGYFVHFIKESDDEDACSSSCFLRGPVAGDDLLVQEQQPPGSGTIGILATATVADEVKHYATTCYHVCFQDLPKTDMDEQHRILKNDFENNAQGCTGVKYEYTTDGNRDLLGNFGYGLYNDYHDIALVELEKNLDCTDAINSLNERAITLPLATHEDVASAMHDANMKAKIDGITKDVVNVQKIGSVTGVTTGHLYAIKGPKRCRRNKRCYRIANKPGTIFAKRGDSGSLVYLIQKNRKIPFGYLCFMESPNAYKAVYYCRNLLHSMKEIERHHHELNNINPCLPHPNEQE